MSKCPTCYGVGKIIVSTVFGSTDEECPKCKGTGRATEEGE